MTLRSRSLLPLLLVSSTLTAAAGFDAAVLDGFDRFPCLWNTGSRAFDGRSFTAGGAKARFGRTFAASEDRELGDTLTVEPLDNRAPGPGPGGWRLLWGDEFNEPAGQPPNPARWTHEIGDGTANGIPGWGNGELQSYTDRLDNAATDGAGHLAITAARADGSLSCHYGPCQYTSARLISRDKAEFAYGRIEARIRVPRGPGLWPAFWSLGTNIGEVGWPQAGEIDFMEFVGRRPNEIFGSLHGPGYSGGQSVTGGHDFGTAVGNAHHVFAVEWQPNRIDWFVDGIRYHSATAASVAPNPWVFNHPFFLVLNLAVGGFLAGPVAPETVFPQSMLVDYVRVYQGPDTAARGGSGTTPASFRREIVHQWGEPTLEQGGQPTSSLSRSRAHGALAAPGARTTARSRRLWPLTSISNPRETASCRATR